VADEEEDTVHQVARYRTDRSSRWSGINNRSRRPLGKSYASSWRLNRASVA
jgi:hypothetical protein